MTKNSSNIIPVISVVTTLYYSSPYINDFYSRIKQELTKLNLLHELIFVNDGRTDDSIEVIKQLIETDPTVILIELSRNFGHHKAILTGINHAQGNYVFLIDSDLEESPELLSRFWEEMNKDIEADVIFGIQEKRKGSFAEQISGALFYKTFNLISDIKIPENFVTARLMKGDYCKELLKFKEHELFLGGLWAATGFNQKGIVIQKSSTSPSTYSFNKRLKLFFNSITSFSDAPLKFIFILGIVMSFISFGFGVFWVVRKYFLGNYLEGWTTIMVSLLILSSIIIFSLGVIGLYVAKIFIEVKNRPYTIVRKIHKQNDTEQSR